MPISWTQQVENMFTSTWAYRRKTAQEQAYLKTPLIFWLKERGRVEELRGYTRVEIPLEYGSNEAVRWIGRGGTVPLTDSELLTMAYDDWKYVAVSIMRFGTDDQKNRGQAALIKLVETKINAAERALNEEFERAFWASGAGADEPNGLQNLIADTPTSGTVHNIDRATYTWFRNQYKASSGVASIYLYPDMRNMLNTISRYSRSEIKDIIMITDQTTYELYEDEVLEYKQISNQTLGDAGFESLQVKGRPFTWMPSAPTGKVYFINPAYLRLVIDPDYYMQMTEWKPIPDQVNDRVAQILCTQQLVISRPVACGVLTGISAT